MTTKIQEKPKSLAKKGDFPLELRVSYDKFGNVVHIASEGPLETHGFTDPETADTEELKIFTGAPEKVRFGSEYQRVSVEERDGVKITRYINITKYD